jgi:hypothetical protein
MVAGKGGSDVGTELRGANTDVVAATGDDSDLRARRDNGTESGSVGREGVCTRRGVACVLLAEIDFDPSLLQAHKVGPALRLSQSTVTKGAGVPQKRDKRAPSRHGG